MFVDASAIFAIMMKEPRFEIYFEKLKVTEGQLITSVIAVWETTAAIFRKKNIAMAEAASQVNAFLEAANIGVVPILNEDLPTALQAFERYGRHHYPTANRNSALNFADCFHYATAKFHHAPILTKDAGFALTDLETIGAAKGQ